MKPKVQPLGAAFARERRDGGQVKLSTFIPLKIRKRGASKVVVRPDGQIEAPGKVATQYDQPLLMALTRAFYWQQLLDDGVVGSGSEIAQREGLHHSTVNELLRLTLLEPAIVQSILAGQQPRCMSLLWFQRNRCRPNGWRSARSWRGSTCDAANAAQAITTWARTSTFRARLMAAKIADTLLMVGLPDFDSIRCRLLAGL